jgi:transposase
MRKIKEILRLLLFIGLTQRQVARATSVARSTVAEYAEKATALGLSWAAIDALSEAELDRLFFPPPQETPTKPCRPLPDWAEVDTDFRQHRHLTLMQVWREYREQFPEGYGFSQFHNYFRQWKKKQDRVMRQSHRAGEKLFIDFGDGPLIYMESDETIKAQIFVIVWGASNYAFIRASLSQDLPSWIQLHVAAFEFFGCVAHILIPDNLKSGVSRACRYEPDLNPTYQDMALHYGTAVVPARPYKAKDKPKVEAGVRLAKMWILAALRKRTFHSLAELNEAISQLLPTFNNRVMRRTKKSRKELFESLDHSAALSLPADRFEFCTWHKCTIGPDYHIIADDHYYSVPESLVGENVDFRLTANTVEVLFRGSRVASHVRSYIRGGCTTMPEHMTEGHRRFAAMTHENLQAWAQETGSSTTKLFEEIRRRHNGAPSTINAWRGIFNLGGQHGQQRIEQAAAHALTYGSCSYASLKKILASNLDKLDSKNRESSAQTLPEHENIRGDKYYASEESVHAE